ncbi:MAG: hypothetical protein Hyperionvirus5_1 [Hyperionvirus sp.]|uniref:Uncharacterized protein n=1 Tax=Hyperionvirus sp. TaxID=2487770 RepID=A0A3G5A7I6_9VIRU|nr:MAG: hypothetical protein Hyperionvirus5_1 [Hyperionvirus sp.]
MNALKKPQDLNEELNDHNKIPLKKPHYLDEDLDEDLKKGIN